MHTPGPWYIVGNEIHDRITKWDERGMRIGETPNCIAMIDIQPIPNEKMDNAHLIAAAPDLLAALEGILNVASVRIDDPRIKQWDAAKAAVAKAKGEANGR